ncbi:MAG: DUF3108 domain-containing protein [Acidobacteriota bacterium]
MLPYSISNAAGFRRTLLGSLLCLGCWSASGETLHYTVNWPSGLSLGEATVRSDLVNTGSAPDAAKRWDLSAMLDAAIPGFTLRDEYRAESDDKFCSSKLEKTVIRGSRKSTEKVTFDQANKIVRRETSAGGKSEYSVPGCVHDALSFLQFVRQELAQGRLAPSQVVVLGAKYDIQLTYTGSEFVKHGDKMVDADRVHVAVKGPKADVSADLYFAKDPARTPLVARIPLAMGTFSVELE